jgi:hypothetical protein
MSSLSKTKKIVYGLILFVLAIALYFTYFSSPSSSSKVIVDSGTSGDGSSTLVGQDILDLVDSLQRVSIDQSVFVNPLFQNLKDFTVTVQREPIGRSNPFAPLGL